MNLNGLLTVTQLFFECWDIHARTMLQLGYRFWGAHIIAPFSDMLIRSFNQFTIICVTCILMYYIAVNEGCHIMSTGFLELILQLLVT